MEIWKDIEGTDGRYSVSNEGNIRSNGFFVNTGKILGGKRFISKRVLKPQNHPCGYKCYTFSNLKTTTIHRLVANAFLSNPENKEFVNHKNGIKSDNRLENIEWATRRENEDHAFETGLKKIITSSVLNEKKVLFILDNCHKIPTPKLAKMMNVSSATINRVIQRVIWSHIPYNKPVIPKKGKWNQVLDLNTGIYYDSCNDAARSINIQTQNLRLMLNGSWKNRTNMIFV